MHKQRVLIIGEIFVDTHLDCGDNENCLVRLGGVFHSVRACSALNTPFALAYYSPAYLVDSINKYAKELNAIECVNLGNINDCPNILLISETKELGDQGYNCPLRKQISFNENDFPSSVIESFNPTDIIVYPGKYRMDQLSKYFETYTGRLHFDLHYDYDNLFESEIKTCTTLIISTSSQYFKNNCSSNIEKLREKLKSFRYESLLVKENRGGSICFFHGKVYESPAFLFPIKHSVGVGDVYNILFISGLLDVNSSKMKLAAYFASIYASTFSFQEFKTDTERMLANTEEIKTLKGFRLPWNERASLNIYLAAPDFPSIDTSLLVNLADKLKYHGFKPRLPIRENGLVTPKTSAKDKLSIYSNDIALLSQCKLLIAVILSCDPGTFVEMGMFKQIGKPVIVFDPYGKCDNMFVEFSADLYCKTLEEVITSVFICLGRVL